MTPLRSILRAARGRLGLSQDEVAERAGITKGHLSRLETGETPRPRPPTLARLADALSLDLESLEVATTAPPNSSQDSGQSAVDSMQTDQSPAQQGSDREVNDASTIKPTAGRPRRSANSGKAQDDPGDSRETPLEKAG